MAGPISKQSSSPYPLSPSFNEKLPNQPDQPTQQGNGTEALRPQHNSRRPPLTDSGYFSLSTLGLKQPQALLNPILKSDSQAQLAQTVSVSAEEVAAHVTYSEVKESEWPAEAKAFFAAMEDLFSLLNTEAKKYQENQKIIQKKIKLNTANIKMVEMHIKFDQENPELNEDLNWLHQQAKELYQAEYNLNNNNKYILINEKIDELKIDFFALYGNTNQKKPTNIFNME